MSQYVRMTVCPYVREFQVHRAAYAAKNAINIEENHGVNFTIPSYPTYFLFC